MLSESGIVCSYQSEWDHTIGWDKKDKLKISAFDGYGITVYIGAMGTVRDAVNAFKQGKLQKAGISDACGKHTFSDRHHF